MKIWKSRGAALALCLALVLAALGGPADAVFTDIADSTVAEAAAVLQGLGVVSGTTETTFQPEKLLTRAEICVMVVNAAGLSSQVSAYARHTMFTDVPSTAWYSGYVNLAYSQGLISGNGDGTFSPDSTVTYGQLATILLRLLGYTTEEVGAAWPLDHTSYCDQLGLSEGLGLGAYDSVTRGQAAVLLYRTIRETVSGTDQPYYETISGVSATAEAILLDTDAAYGGGTGLAMVYALDSGIVYYTQATAQSAQLEGSLGTLLLDASGHVMGFLPKDGGWEDVYIDSATASTLTAVGGSGYRISSGAVVISGGETYDYTTSGYLVLDGLAGSTVRLYRDDDGAVICLYVSGGTATTSEAAVAETTSANSSLSRALGIAGQSYSITKNGAAAEAADLAQYDVGYYDAATNTLRASDYRVSGYLTAASPSVTAAETLTVAGCTFDVLECAWETLGEFRSGDRVTLLLTDDGKVAAVYPYSEVKAEMLGVLAQDGRSVTLSGSGATLTANTMNYDESLLGSLVLVSVNSATTISCSTPSSGGARNLDLTEGTMGSLELAPACAVYEWAGSGYVYDLEGNAGEASDDFDAIFWTDTVASAQISYYHTNDAGQIDVLLLNDVTGSCYDYGLLTAYTGEAGIDLGGGIGNAYNRAATLTNSAGTTEKYLCSHGTGDGRYVGIALEGTSYGYTRVTAVEVLDAVSGVEAADFFLQDGRWYVEADGDEYPVSEQVEIYLDDADGWSSGYDALTAVLADGHRLTLYCDGDAQEGAQVRILVAQ